MALAMHLLDVRDAHDLPAFYDYVDRWMSEDDSVWHPWANEVNMHGLPDADRNLYRWNLTETTRVDGWQPRQRPRSFLGRIRPSSREHSLIRRSPRGLRDKHRA